MLVIKYHRIHSVREHFFTERTMQFEGDTIMYTLTEVGFTFLLSPTTTCTDKGWVFKVEHSDSVLQVHKRVFLMV